MWMIGRSGRRGKWLTISQLRRRIRIMIIHPAHPISSRLPLGLSPSSRPYRLRRLRRPLAPTGTPFLGHTLTNTRFTAPNDITAMIGADGAVADALADVDEVDLDFVLGPAVDAGEEGEGEALDAEVEVVFAHAPNFLVVRVGGPGVHGHFENFFVDLLKGGWG